MGKLASKTTIEVIDELSLREIGVSLHLLSLFFASGELLWPFVALDEEAPLLLSVVTEKLWVELGAVNS